MPYLEIDPRREARIPSLVESPTEVGKVTIYWDTGRGAPVGFGLLVRAPTKRHRFNATWIVQFDKRRAKIARFGELPVERARVEAVKLRERMQRGENPNAAKRRERAATHSEERVQAFTLQEAIDSYIDHLRRHGSPATVKSAEYETRRYLREVLHRPLSELTTDDMAGLHERITDHNGPRAANKALKTIRAAWNHAHSRNSGLPPNIVAGKKDQRGFAYNRETFGGDSISWQELPAWWAKVHSIRNPVRRDLQLLGLFTGMRAADCTTLRWDDIDLVEGTMHRPNPKGGRAKAFTVPVCSFVLDLLRSRRDENRQLFGDDGGWVFPTDRVRGAGVTHLREMKEQRYEDDPETGKRVKRRWLPSPHALRRTFGSACVAAGVREHHKHVLLNHAPRRSSVGDRYVNLDLDDLRTAVESAAEFLLEKTGVGATRHRHRAS